MSTPANIQQVTQQMAQLAIEPPKIQLEPHQPEHVERLISILMRFHGTIDGSRMGSGKTFTTGYVAKHFMFALLIICPVGVIDTWKRLAATYQIPIYDIIS